MIASTPYMASGCVALHFFGCFFPIFKIFCKSSWFTYTNK
ncbi:hypothetical protein TREAZ_2250 [Leadbettera azotonutricia ZAS-9]|uniref:Uncharacterized protein n=1 Tax=Leadbettera azotonutricia (strain ATCC BAA-888 / DSM 13862 / ZAS-9) TaxID=545695 RepID=F5Y855_LEAAZ|nr:hypothetical protein TREAZ_2250 [Leadbettera azotonutricia ZAS-9]